MKKIILLLNLVFLAFSLMSCNNNLCFTDKKKELKYGTYTQDCISYSYYDLNTDSEITKLYYCFPDSVIIGMVDQNKKGKFTLSKLIYDPVTLDICSVQDLKTYILKPGKLVKLSCDIGYSYFKGEEYKSFQFGILLYENCDIYYEIV